jgi:anti-sigma28 factor (negative regulator of flagellin synthesis)
MADPIQGVNPVDVSGIAPTGGPASQPAAPRNLQTDAVPGVDTADVSRAEAVLTTIAQSSATVSSVNQLQIAQLQEALNSGTYQANPQLIAERIMEIESLLSSSNNP